jgi:hypothetical protein
MWIIADVAVMIRLTYDIIILGKTKPQRVIECEIQWEYMWMRDTFSQFDLSWSSIILLDVWERQIPVMSL